MRRLLRTRNRKTRSTVSFVTPGEGPYRAALQPVRQIVMQQRRARCRFMSPCLLAIALGFPVVGGASTAGPILQYFESPYAETIDRLADVFMVDTVPSGCRLSAKPKAGSRSATTCSIDSDSMAPSMAMAMS